METVERTLGVNDLTNTRATFTAAELLAAVSTDQQVNQQARNMGLIDAAGGIVPPRPLGQTGAVPNGVRIRVIEYDDPLEALILKPFRFKRDGNNADETAIARLVRFENLETGAKYDVSLSSLVWDEETRTDESGEVHQYEAGHIGSELLNKELNGDLIAELASKEVKKGNRKVQERRIFRTVVTKYRRPDRTRDTRLISLIEE